MLRPLLLAFLLAACSSTPGGPPAGGGGSGGSAPPVEVCDNHADDDDNGFIDCADPACQENAACPACGDGLRTGGEVCDGTDLGGASCASLEFNGSGSLRCKPDCTIDTSACTRHESCEQPGDEDQNGLSDCADPSCSQLGSCLSFTADPLPPSPRIATAVTLTLHAADGAGVPLAGKAVHLDVAGASPLSADALLDGAGVARFEVRLGNRASPVHLTATLDSGKARLELELNPVDAQPGTIVTVLDADRITGTDDSGPARDAHVGTPTGMAVGEDGTVYVSESCRVLAISPDGMLSRVAGTGFCGVAPQEGEAIHADISVDGIALDGPRGRLFIVDRSSGLLRFVDLADGRLHAMAGGGTLTVAQALGGPATLAALEPLSVAAGPDGTVAMGEGKTGQILTIEPDALSLDLLTTTRTGAACGDLALSDAGANLAFDAAGTVFAGGRLCGARVGSGGPTPGIVRIDDGAAIHLAGRMPGALPQGVPATSAELAGVAASTFDASGNLLVASGDDVLRIEAVSGEVRRIGGAGIPSFAGEGEPLSLARFHGPTALAFGPGGDLYIADGGNGCVRRVVALGAPAPTRLNVNAVSGDGQTAVLAQVLPAPFRVRVTDSVGTPLAGLQLALTPGDPGLGVVSVPRTDAGGFANLQGRLGLVPGPASFVASFPGIHRAPAEGSSATFSVTAVAPDSGTVFTAAGDASATFQAIPPGRRIPAPGAPLYVSRAVAASNGDLYVSSYCQIFRLHQGTLEAIAGTGTCAASTAGVPATSTSFYVTDIALDEAANALYVAEYGDVRRIDLAKGVVEPFAGPGRGVDGDGDGGPALAATFGTLARIELGDDGMMYLGGSGALRRIDRSTGVIDTLIPPMATCTGPELSFSGFVAGLRLIGGELWISGYACKDGASTSGLMRRDAQGGLTFFPVTSAGVLEPAPGGGILVGAYYTLVGLDPGTGAVTLLAGDTTRPRGGDYGPAKDAGLGFVTGLAHDKDGHLLVSDGALRVIW